MSENSDFGTFGRYRELPIGKMTADQKKAYEFTMKERGQVPGPYKIFLQNPKLIEVMVPFGRLLPRSLIAVQSGDRDRHELDKCEVVSRLLELRTRNYCRERWRFAAREGGSVDRWTSDLVRGFPAADHL